MAIGWCELLLLAIQCIIVEFRDLWEERANYLCQWRRRTKCFQYLPLELVAEIVESFTFDKIDQRESTFARQRNLLFCTRTSTWLSRLSQRELFRRPYLTYHLERFERALRAKPELVNLIEHVTFDLREDPIPTVESDATTRIIKLLASSRTRSMGLMEVRNFGLGHLACIPQLERLHLHLMNYPSHFIRFPPLFRNLPVLPFVNLTSLSLSAIHLPYPAGDSSPVSELYTPEMLPNLRALEIDECCIRIVAKVNEHHFLRYLAIRCSCTRCIPELRLDATLFDPLELFEINPHPYFLTYFRDHPHRLPRFRRLRLAAEFMRFRSAKAACVVLQVLIDSLKYQHLSPLRDLVQLSLPNYWDNHYSEDVRCRVGELNEWAERRGVQVDFDVEDEGNRANRATRAASLVSDFWSVVDGLEARKNVKIC